MMTDTQQQKDAQREQALTIIRRAYREQPQLPTLAINAEANAIAAWDKNLQRFVMVAAYAITGQWVSMPYELLVNGQRIPNEWTEYPREAVNGFPRF